MCVLGYLPALPITRVGGPGYFPFNVEPRGDLFCPPDASHTYVTRLRVLVKEEDVVRQKRKDVFFNPDFVARLPVISRLVRGSL